MLPDFLCFIPGRTLLSVREVAVRLPSTSTIHVLILVPVLFAFMEGASATISLGNTYLE